MPLAYQDAQFSSLAQLCPTLCNPMDCTTQGFPVHCQLLGLAQTHIHRVSDAIQPSHPLSSPSLPAFNLPQRQGLFKFFDDCHSDWCEMIPHCSFDLHFCSN